MSECIGSLNPYWVVGFADGEGSFTVSMPRSIICRLKYGVAVRPMFLISQDDGEIIKKIHEFFGFGRVKEHTARKGHMIFLVDKPEGLEKIRNFFTRYPLQTKKKYDFEKWCQILDLIKAGKHRSIEGIYEIAKIRDTMNTKKKGKSNPGYMNAAEILSYLRAREASNYRAWSSHELEAVSKLYGKVSIYDIARQINRTPKSIYHKAIELGLAKKRNEWTKEEIEFLRENYLHLKDATIALRLNRSIASVVRKRIRLGLMKYENKRFVRRNSK